MLWFSVVVPEQPCRLPLDGIGRAGHVGAKIYKKKCLKFWQLTPFGVYFSVDLLC